jgi:hypothetical protein
MDQLAALIALLALVVSVIALLLALATTLRINSVERLGNRSILGLAVGTAIPAGALAKYLPPDELDAFLAGPTLAIFGSAECPPCRDLYGRLNRLPSPTGRVYLVETEGRSSAFVPNWVRKVVDKDRSMQHAFAVGGTPTTFLVRQGHVVDKAMGANVSGMESSIWLASGLSGKSSENGETRPSGAPLQPR